MPARAWPAPLSVGPRARPGPGRPPPGVRGTGRKASSPAQRLHPRPGRAVEPRRPPARARSRGRRPAWTGSPAAGPARRSVRACGGRPGRAPPRCRRGSAMHGQGQCVQVLASWATSCCSALVARRSRRARGREGDDRDGRRGARGSPPFRISDARFGSRGLAGLHEEVGAAFFCQHASDFSLQTGRSLPYEMMVIRLAWMPCDTR